MNISNNNDNHFLYLIVHHLHYEIVQIFVVNDVDINYNNKKLKISLIEKFCNFVYNLFIIVFFSDSKNNDSIEKEK